MKTKDDPRERARRFGTHAGYLMTLPYHDRITPENLPSYAASAAAIAAHDAFLFRPDLKQEDSNEQA
jgi:hypothetical protein